MTDSPLSISRLLSDEGPFQLHLKGFRARPGQQKMALAIAGALRNNHSLALEVASGAGKTLAYLVAAIDSNSRTIISTASHQLQRQLYRGDIPLVQKALGSQKQVVQLKGRSNYLCPYYLNKHLHEASGEMKSRLSLLSRQYAATGQGDLSHYTIEDNRLRYAVTASAEECLGAACPDYQHCPWIHARKRSQQADIVIVNHSLLLSDKTLFHSADTTVAARAETVIVDEAHRLVDFARHHGVQVNSWQLSAFCRDALASLADDAPEQAQLCDYLAAFLRLLSRLKQSEAPSTAYVAEQHLSIQRVLVQWCQPLVDTLRRFAQRSAALNALSIRSQQLLKTLRDIGDGSGLCWFETRHKGFVLQSVPVSLSNHIRQLCDASAANWIFTSATLAIAGNPERFLTGIGLPEIEFKRIESDIDYAANALLYTPVLRGEPGDNGYSEQLVEQLLLLLGEIPGRALLLFSSHRALQQVAQLLGQHQQLDCFVQGSMENHRLINCFKSSPGGVLLATGSFWEGLDLADTALACVFIDKLPFASPGDPRLAFHANYLAGMGVDAFQQEQLPAAVIRLRQGCGRLLRRLDDRGVIMLADPRLHSRDYAELFIRSLPAMQQVREIDEVKAFFQQHVPAR